MMRHIEPNLNPPDYDDGVTYLQEEVLGFLEEHTLLPSIINDQICELVIFYEKHSDGEMDDFHYREDLAEKLHSMSVQVSKSIETHHSKK